jgi:hypothetical protein
MKKIIARATVCLALATAASAAHAGGVSYTCAPSIKFDGGGGLCGAINSIVGGDYNSIFSNANASIYIQFADNGGLGGSTSGYLNLVTYSAYTSALAAHSSGDATDTAAVASLPAVEPAQFDGGDIELTSALAEALGITSNAGGYAILGTTAGGAPCSTPGTNGCYNGIVTLNDPADLAAITGGQGYSFTTGTPAPNQYDIYSLIEHETDEVLGTSSCITTDTGSLADGCYGSNASAVDLFRYQDPGTPVFVSSTPGAYFSADGGVTQTGPAYNTLANGNDYADFDANCSTVQDATGCLGGALDIATDGGAEVAILDAVGYNLNTVASATVPPPAATPEPGTLTMLGSAMLGLGKMVRRRRGVATR